MKKLLALILALALALGGLEASAEEPEIINNWSADSPAMQSIVQFVTDSVDEASEGFIPKADRIAVFDFDGTLYGERFPTSFNLWFNGWRALHCEDYDAPERLKVYAAQKEAQLLYGTEFKTLDAEAQMLFNGSGLFEGLTREEYTALVRRFKELPVWGFEGMTYGEGYFQPMLSLVRYLYENGYSIYICSGSDRDATRVMMEGTLDQYIPADHVIGTDFLYKASEQGDQNGSAYTIGKDEKLIISGCSDERSVKTNKATAIQREIGKMPVLAFGNSTGDFSMATYTLQNEKYGGRAYMLLCDDTARDHGDPAAAAAFKAKCDANGFYTVSEKDEFETLYPQGVVMCGAEVSQRYTLDRMVVLSRHNIRSPMSGSGSLLSDITPHSWFQWTSQPSELSVRGGTLETIMGQYFRQRLEAEGLFPKNYQPEDGEVRFYANAKQRTIATSRFFSAGLLPVWDTPIETHAEYDAMDPVFSPKLTFCTSAYAEDVIAQISEMGGDAGLEGIRDGLRDAFSLLMDVTDMKESESYRAGKYGDLLQDATELIIEEGSEPGVRGPIKTGTSVADALTLQYYEETDAKKAAFGHKLSDDDWKEMHRIVDTFTDMLFTAPLVSVNVAHPLLEELREELLADGRKFSFLCGHDSNIASVLAALGVEEYELPNTVEPRTPIGVKLVFARYLDRKGEAYYTVSLVYQSTQQLRQLSLLSPENPPMEAFLRFAGAEANADGMIAEDDLLALFDKSISAYDSLRDEYAEEALPAAA